MEFHHAIAALDSCAEIMAKGRDGTVDLSLDQVFSELLVFSTLIRAHLAAKVKELSGDTLTVKVARPNLSGVVVHGWSAELVVCPAATPKGFVEQLTEGMTLYLLTLSRNGLVRVASA